MSARAWRARKGNPDARDERRVALQCRRRYCILNRRKHRVHFLVLPGTHPADSWVYGTNRMGRRKARKSGA